MSKDEMYVWGGVFRDGSFTKLESAEAEHLSGPFDSEQVAAKAVMEGMRKNVDTCWHRLFVVAGGELEARRAAALA